MSMINIFIPTMDGSFVPVTYKSREETLKSEEVFIFTDEETRDIFIWTGASSNVRKRFISSQIARQIRFEKGMTYHVSTHEEGNETAKFITMMEKIEASPGSVTSTKGFDVSPISIPREDGKPMGFVGDEESTYIKKGSPTTAEVQKPKKTTPKRVPPKKVAGKPKVESKPAVQMRQRPVTASANFSENVHKNINPDSAKKVEVGAVSTISSIFISCAHSDGKFQLFSVNADKGKKFNCKLLKPLLVIYFKTGWSSGSFNLDIDVAEGHTLYYSSPKDTFFHLKFV